MAYARGVVASVVGVILLTALLSGPLVPGVDLTNEPPEISEQGTATVTTVALPERATIERASFGAKNYHLTLPPATVEVSAIEGSATLSYRLEIPALNYTRTTTHFLSERIGARYELTMQSDTLSLERVTADRYDGTVSVVKRDASGESMLDRRQIAIEVRE